MLTSIALFDIDNTMYQGFSYFDLLKKQITEKLINQQVLDDAIASMQKYKANAQDYESTLVELLDIYANGLKGVRYDRVLESTKDFYIKSDKFFDYVAPTFAELKKTHAIALVTGEPQFVAQAVCELLGADAYHSTEYEVVGGVLTGRIKSYLASAGEKHDAVRHLIRKYGTKNSFAFGDSEGDIEMLRATEHPICLNATDGLRAIAKKEGWQLPNIDDVAVLVARLVGSN